MKNKTKISHFIVQNLLVACLRAATSIVRLHVNRRGSLRIMQTISILTIMFMTIVTAHGEQTNLPTIFVAPISGSSHFHSWQTSVGESVAEVLINQLASSRKFGVLETTALEAIRKEIAMGTDGWMEPGKKKEKGGWFGADYMLTGKLTHFDPPPKGSGSGPIQSLPFLFPKKARVQILWRVVNTSTRKIVATGNADSSETKEKFNVVKTADVFLSGSEDGAEALEKALNLVLGQIIAAVERLDLSLTERVAFMEQTGKSAPGAVGRIVGTVEAVKPDCLIVGLGTKHGCKTGDKLELCETSEIKNSEGATVFKDEKVVGEVEIEMCLEDRSKVRYSTLVPPKEGWIVRCKNPEVK